jgi:hypothetical protein
MNDNTPKIGLEQLRRQRDAKFDEIVSCLRRELYADVSFSQEADRQRLLEEAEELTDKWADAEANNRPLELSTTLQILLSEHQQICKHIIDIIDAANGANDHE